MIRCTCNGGVRDPLCGVCGDEAQALQRVVQVARDVLAAPIPGDGHLTLAEAVEAYDTAAAP